MNTNWGNPYPNEESNYRSHTQVSGNPYLDEEPMYRPHTQVSEASYMNEEPDCRHPTQLSEKPYTSGEPNYYQHTHVAGRFNQSHPPALQPARGSCSSWPRPHPTPPVTPRQPPPHLSVDHGNRILPRYSNFGQTPQAPTYPPPTAASSSYNPPVFLPPPVTPRPNHNTNLINNHNYNYDNYYDDNKWGNTWNTLNSNHTVTSGSLNNTSSECYNQEQSSYISPTTNTSKNYEDHYDSRKDKVVHNRELGRPIEYREDSGKTSLSGYSTRPYNKDQWNKSQRDKYGNRYEPPLENRDHRYTRYPYERDSRKHDRHHSYSDHSYRSRSPGRRTRSRSPEKFSPRSKMRSRSPSRSRFSREFSREKCKEVDYKYATQNSRATSRDNLRGYKESRPHSRSPKRVSHRRSPNSDISRRNADFDYGPASYDTSPRSYKGQNKFLMKGSTYRADYLKPYSTRHSSTLSESISGSRDIKDMSERDILLHKYRENYCLNTKDMYHKLEELAKMEPEEILEDEKKVWTRSAPADLYYTRDDGNGKVMKATPRLVHLCNKFEEELVTRAERVRLTRPRYEPPPRRNRLRLAVHKSEMCTSSNSLSDDDNADELNEEDCTMEELERKRMHPYRLHPELWYNDPGEMNDGPLCRCSARARRNGMRHGIYAGETHLPKCNPDTNNADQLYHYRITISPPTNFLTKTPTIINHDEHEFIFEGFSMFSHFSLGKIPTCKVIRFNIEYTILYIEEKFPENFTIRELDLFHDYLFRELLELVDLDFKAYNDTNGCAQFHFMPRFVRDLPDNGKEILSMNEVLLYLLASNTPLIQEDRLNELLQMPQFMWQNFADEVKGMVVTYPGMKPCSVRVDQLDRDQPKKGEIVFPEIVHFGIRPPQLSYAGNPEYQKAWRSYVKFRHLIANMAKPSFEDKRKLEAKENKLQDMRTQSKMKRDVTVAMSAKGFYRTGIMCDIIQHAMLIPVLVCHLRFHRSCNELENVINYKFKNRYLLQLALTHPSYRENFGTNPDHARNSLTNCGIRQPEYGDRRIHYMNTRKRGINTLINIMSRFGKKEETESNIAHNERLEFLGDAVVEFISSVHLFYIFPDLEEGGLATYRAAIVQNQYLAVLAKTLNLDKYMLYAHGSDLCHDLELRHAMANCFEALMGALFLDGGIDEADKMFGQTLYGYEEDTRLLRVWTNLSPHPLQVQDQGGDRHYVPSYPILQKLTQFEDLIGVRFKHIRLLARAFTDRSIGYTNLTLGSNQRLEFLGDTVLQLISSEYLYKHFPEHHEGHLSLLRSSLVNNRTQAVVCNDLGMTQYALYANPKAELKTKDRADLLEAFLGALYVDKDLVPCQVFCNVCFFPRLRDFIMNQDWNDPKSKLQQCCLTLRSMDGGEPDIPVYKVVECKGPTNTREYSVAVYFRGERLATASGHSIQQAEMSAAKQALEMSHSLFPQLDHQKRVIAKSMKKQRGPKRSNPSSRSRGNPINTKEHEELQDSRRSREISPHHQLTSKDAEELHQSRGIKEKSLTFEQGHRKRKSQSTQQGIEVLYQMQNKTSFSNSETMGAETLTTEQMQDNPKYSNCQDGAGELEQEELLTVASEQGQSDLNPITKEGEGIDSVIFRKIHRNPSHSDIQKETVLPTKQLCKNPVNILIREKAKKRAPILKAHKNQIRFNIKGDTEREEFYIVQVEDNPVNINIQERAAIKEIQKNPMKYVIQEKTVKCGLGMNIESTIQEKLGKNATIIKRVRRDHANPNTKEKLTKDSLPVTEVQVNPFNIAKQERSESDIIAFKHGLKNPEVFNILEKVIKQEKIDIEENAVKSVLVTKLDEIGIQEESERNILAMKHKGDNQERTESDIVIVKQQINPENVDILGTIKQERIDMEEKTVKCVLVTKPDEISVQEESERNILPKKHKDDHHKMEENDIIFIEQVQMIPENVNIQRKTINHEKTDMEEKAMTSTPAIKPREIIIQGKAKGNVLAMKLKAGNQERTESDFVAIKQWQGNLENVNILGKIIKQERIDMEEKSMTSIPAIKLDEISNEDKSARNVQDIKKNDDNQERTKSDNIFIVHKQQEGIDMEEKAMTSTPAFKPTESIIKGKAKENVLTMKLKAGNQEGRETDLFTLKQQQQQSNPDNVSIVRKFIKQKGIKNQEKAVKHAREVKAEEVGIQENAERDILANTRKDGNQKRAESDIVGIKQWQVNPENVNILGKIIKQERIDMEEKPMTSNPAIKPREMIVQEMAKGNVLAMKLKAGNQEGMETDLFTSKQQQSNPEIVSIVRKYMKQKGIKNQAKAIKHAREVGIQEKAERNVLAMNRKAGNRGRAGSSIIGTKPVHRNAKDRDRAIKQESICIQENAMNIAFAIDPNETSIQEEVGRNVLTMKEMLKKENYMKKGAKQSPVNCNTKKKSKKEGFSLDKIQGCPYNFDLQERASRQGLKNLKKDINIQEKTIESALAIGEELSIDEKAARIALQMKLESTIQQNIINKSFTKKGVKKNPISLKVKEKIVKKTFPLEPVQGNSYIVDIKERDGNKTLSNRQVVKNAENFNKLGKAIKQEQDKSVDCVLPTKREEIDNSAFATKEDRITIYERISNNTHDIEKEIGMREIVEKNTYVIKGMQTNPMNLKVKKKVMKEGLPMKGIPGNLVDFGSEENMIAIKQGIESPQDFITIDQSIKGDCENKLEEIIIKNKTENHSLISNQEMSIGENVKRIQRNPANHNDKQRIVKKGRVMGNSFNFGLEERAVSDTIAIKKQQKRSRNFNIEEQVVKDNLYFEQEHWNINNKIAGKGSSIMEEVQGNPMNLNIEDGDELEDRVTLAVKEIQKCPENFNIETKVGKDVFPNKETKNDNKEMAGINLSFLSDNRRNLGSCSIQDVVRMDALSVNRVRMDAVTLGSEKRDIMAIAQEQNNPSIFNVDKETVNDMLVNKEAKINIQEKTSGNALILKDAQKYLARVNKKYETGEVVISNDEDQGNTVDFSLEGGERRDITAIKQDQEDVLHFNIHEKEVNIEQEKYYSKKASMEELYERDARAIEQAWWSPMPLSVEQKLRNVNFKVEKSWKNPVSLNANEKIKTKNLQVCLNREEKKVPCAFDQIQKCPVSINIREEAIVDTVAVKQVLNDSKGCSSAESGEKRPN